LADEPFAEDDGELGLGLEPFARRPFPFVSRVVAAPLTIAYAVANLREGRSISQSTITALTRFQIRPLRNATR
jgi:hypothetical protein